MLTVGQKLWLVPTQKYFGQPREVEVVKVGRKWAEINFRGYCVSLERLHVDGGQHSSPAQCYTDREAYEADVALDKAWSDLRTKIDRKWGRPEGVTVEAIQQARALLNL